MKTTQKKIYNDAKILALIIVSVGIFMPVISITLNESGNNGSSTNIGPKIDVFNGHPQKGGNNPTLYSNSSPNVLCNPTCPDPW